MARKRRKTSVQNVIAKKYDEAISLLGARARCNRLLRKLAVTFCLLY